MAHSPDPEVRTRAIEAIAKAKEKADFDTIFRALADPDPTVRAAAREALTTLGPDAVFSRVMNALRQANLEVPPEAIDRALPMLRPTLEPRMLKLLKTKNDSTVSQKVAAYCLGRMGSKSAVPLLSKLVWSPDRSLAIICANALLQIGDDTAFDAYRKMVRHPVPEVRWAAIIGLSRIGGPQALTLITYAALGTTETNLAIRRKAVEILGRIGGHKTIPVLIDILATQPALRRQSLAALRQLTGYDAGGTATDWAQWYHRLSQPPPRPPAPPQPPANQRRHKKKSKRR